MAPAQTKPVHAALALLLALAAPLAPAALAHAAAGAALDPTSIVRLAPSVVLVQALSPAGALQLGSGVVVAAETVVTNCHVTRAAHAVAVVQAGTRLSANAQSPDTEHDLCLLQVPGLKAAAVALGSAAALAIGQPVLALGFTAGTGPQISRGRVVALHRWDGGHVVQSNTGFSSGASGGGLFNARSELVGVLTFRLRGGEIHYYSAPADWLRGRLAAPPDWQEIRPLAGRGFWELRGAGQPRFLRAAALEHSARWPALARFAAQWSREAADDPEPAYMLALAEEAMDRPERAIDAWEQSLRIDADYHRSRVRLARLYHRLGRDAEARRTVADLAEREPQLGRELARELEFEPAENPQTRRP